MHTPWFLQFNTQKKKKNHPRPLLFIPLHLRFGHFMPKYIYVYPRIYLSFNFSRVFFFLTNDLAIFMNFAITYNHALLRV